MAEDFEVLSALLDGEPVEIEQLETALSTQTGRQMLIDFARLRNEARENDDALRPELRERVRRDVTSAPVFLRRQVPLPLAAAAVICAALLASALNTGLFRHDNPTGLPETTRVLRFEPGVDWQMEAR